MHDPWRSGESYHRFMGRWSELVARRFLRWLDAGPGLQWLDVGCGTGTLTRAILEDWQPAEVTAIDPSSEFIAHAQQMISDPAVHFRIGQAEALQVETGSMDAVVCGLVLNFVANPEAAAAEMLRACRPDRRIGVYLWDYANGMQMLHTFWDAAVELDAGAAEHDEGRRFPLCREGRLEAFLWEAGLQQVEAAPIEVETVFKDFDDYWQPFLGGVGPASGYLLGLKPEARLRLEEALRQRLPVAQDGSIPLRARAWAVKGVA